MSEHTTHKPEKSGIRAKSFETDEQESVCIAIVEEVSSATGTDPSQMTPRLNDVVDTDALKRLVDGSSTEVSFTFRFLSCRVTVFGDGDVVVTGPA